MKTKNKKQTFIEKDPYLEPFADAILQRCDHIKYIENKLTGGKMTLNQFASAHTYYGLHK
jgi:hypothetical protein